MIFKLWMGYSIIFFVYAFIKLYMYVKTFDEEKYEEKYLIMMRKLIIGAIPFFVLLVATTVEYYFPLLFS